MAKTKTPSGLSMKHKIGYACGDLGGCMTFALMGSIVTRYYTNVLQVNTVVLATMLLVWNVWDAVNDPLMGALMDKVFAKHHGQGGKFRPWLLRSAPCVAITFIIFFTVPTYFKGVTMLVVLFFCKILYEGFYTMFNIPMGSMLSAMADTDGERAALSSARGFGSMIGNIIPMIIMPQLLAKFGDTSKAFGIGATLCAIVGFVFCMLHYAWTEERHVSVAPSESNDSVKLTDILNVFRVNRPFLALCMSGGNTLIVDVRDYTDFALLGATRDDAAGECFDKAARVLGLPYPGGAAMDKLAHESEGGVYELPRAKIDGCPLDMSFSGLKTAVVNLAHNAEQTGKQLDRAALARDFTQAVVDELVPRAMLAMQQSGRKVLVAAGGVAANSFIRAELEKECRKHGCRLYMPPLKLCGDNGAMIGAQGYYEYLAGARADWALNAYATRDIDDPIV